MLALTSEDRFLCKIVRMKEANVECHFLSVLPDVL